ncbi:MAG: CoA transferase [Candidatus Reddybacter sp.]
MGAPGRGQNIDVAMVDALYHMHEAKVEYHPMRCGAHHRGLAPYVVFKGKEGWIAILAGDLQVAGFIGC